jgi:hypothetical protein
MEAEQMHEVIEDTRPAEFIIPDAFSYEIYKSKNKDLSAFSEEMACAHYARYGKMEGRICSEVDGRPRFINIIPSGKSILEIGPFFSPRFNKNTSDVQFMDILTTGELRERAVAHKGNPDNVPEIDYVWRGEHYIQLIDRRFDCVFSSHCIEHQPCLVSHLKEVSSILAQGGRYFIVAPDKRYCFDNFFPESNVADVLEAFLTGRVLPTPRAVIRAWLIASHNSPSRHWAGDHSTHSLIQPVTAEHGQRIKNAITRFAENPHDDCHAWQFTPDSFAHLVQLLCAAELTDLEVEVIYPTLRNTFEFYAILRQK